jgi:hypothetical protein
VRIPSAKVDQVIYFVAVDSTDLKTRETGLASFTVYRSRNGGAATLYTTPTVAELSAANMPGVYSLLIDEDTTIAAGSDSEEYVVHITQAAMAPVTRSFELYRRPVTTGETLLVTASALGANTITATSIATGAIDADALAADTITAAKVAADVSAEIADAVWDEDATAHQTQGTFGQAIGDPVADTNTIYKAVVTDATGATVGADVVAVKAETASIQSDTDNIQTRLPAALVGGRMDSSVGAMAADTLTASALAADAATEIGNAVWDTDATGRQTQGTFGQAIGDPVADTNTIYKAVVTDATGATVGVDVVAVKAETALILSDTNAILVDTGTTLQAEVDGIQADTEDIQTRLPATLVGGRMDSSVGAMAAATVTAAAIATDAIDADAVTEIWAKAMTELAGPPAAGGTVLQALTFLLMALRNARATTATADTITNDAGATIATAVLSDNGTVFSKGEYA